MSTVLVIVIALLAFGLVPAILTALIMNRYWRRWLLDRRLDDRRWPEDED